MAAEADIGRSTAGGPRAGQPDTDIMDWVQRRILQQMRGDLADIADSIASVNDLSAWSVSPGRLRGPGGGGTARRGRGALCGRQGRRVHVHLFARMAGLHVQLGGHRGSAGRPDRGGCPLRPSRAARRRAGVHGNRRPARWSPGGRASWRRRMRRYDAAEEWFAQAAAAARRMPVPYFVAEALLGRGAMRLRRDEAVDEARPRSRGRRWPSPDGTASA